MTRLMNAKAQVRAAREAFFAEIEAAKRAGLNDCDHGREGVNAAFERWQAAFDDYGAFKNARNPVL